MKLGIFAKTFERPTIRDVFNAVREHQFDCVQFNLSCVGLPTLPTHVPVELCEQIANEARQREISIAAISGTFNLIHPDRLRRLESFKRLRSVAEGCHDLGTSVITLCTGTRDAEDMWRSHPDNDSAEAWMDVVESMHRVLEATDDAGVTLAIEPEPANVVNSAEKALRLIEEVNSPRLKVVFDGANFVHGHARAEQQTILRHALDLLLPFVVLAHAKDLADIGAPVGREDSSHLDYRAYLRLLVEAGFDGPLILHGMAESQVCKAVQYLNETLHDLSTEKTTEFSCHSLNVTV